MWEVDIEAEFERQEKREREANERRQKEAASGLGFGRLNDLNDMNVDLSAQLFGIQEAGRRREARHPRRLAPGVPRG